MPPSDDQRPERSTAIAEPPGPPSAPPGPPSAPPIRTPPPGAPPASGTPPGTHTQQRAVAGLFLAMLSLAGLLGLNNLSRGIYVVLYALLAGTVALWLGVTSLKHARRERTVRPRGSVAAIVIAALGVTISGLMLLAFVVFGQQLSAYGRCLSGANTISTQQSCQDQFTHAVSRQLGTG